MKSPLAKLYLIVALALFVSVGVVGLAYRSQGVSRSAASAAESPRPVKGQELTDEQLIEKVEDPDIPAGSSYSAGAGNPAQITLPDGTTMPMSEFRRIQSATRAVNHTPPPQITKEEWTRYIRLKDSQPPSGMGSYYSPSATNSQMLPSPSRAFGIP